MAYSPLFLNKKGGLYVLGSCRCSALIDISTAILILLRVPGGYKCLFCTAESS